MKEAVCRTCACEANGREEKRPPDAHARKGFASARIQAPHGLECAAGCEERNHRDAACERAEREKGAERRDSEWPFDDMGCQQRSYARSTKPHNDIEFSGEEEGAQATDDESAATRGYAASTARLRSEPPKAPSARSYG